MNKLLVAFVFICSQFALAQSTAAKKTSTAKKQKTTQTQAAPAKVIQPPLEETEAPLAKPKKQAEKQGGFFVEPYVGLDLGLIDATTTSAVPPVGNYSYSANGLALGTRGGYVLANDIFFAGDLQFTVGGQIQATSQPSGSSKPSDSFYKTLLDLQAGWKPLSWFQFWGGYVLLNDLTDQAGSGNKVFHGDGFRLGAGWVVSKHITIGFNYDILTYKKIDASNNNYSINNDYSKFNTQNFHFNCSFPFQF